MRKLFLASMAIASAIALEGCASSTSIRITELNSYNHTQSAKLQSFGAGNMQTLGPVLLKTKDRCVVSQLYAEALKKYSNASDLVNIRMEETTIKSSIEAYYNCKYVGLAVLYKNITPEELKAWKAFSANNPIEVEETEETEETTSIPVANEPTQDTTTVFNLNQNESDNQSSPEFFTR